MISLSDDSLEQLTCCELCEHRCRVNRLLGERGVCRMGLPEVASAGLHSAPPQSFTIFTAGCNFKCLFCQNWTISQHPDSTGPIIGWWAPASLAREALRQLNKDGTAFGEGGCPLPLERVPASCHQPAGPKSLQSGTAQTCSLGDSTSRPRVTTMPRRQASAFTPDGRSF